MNIIPGLPFTPRNIPPYILDNFIGINNTSIASHQPDRCSTGGSWLQTNASSFYIINNTLQPNRKTDGDLAIIDTKVSDYSFSCTVTPYGDATNTAFPCIVFRYVNNTNFWYLNVDCGTGYVMLYCVINGTHNLIVTISTSLTSNVQKKIKVKCKGANIIIYLDDVEVTTYVSSTHATATIVGVRYGKHGSPTNACSWSSFKVEKFTGLVLNWPIFSKYGSNPIVALGAGGSWEDSDINDPNVVWDNSNNRYTLLYSGYKAGDNNVQALGLAYSNTLPGTWTKEAGNPVFTGGGYYGQNGGVLKKGNTYYYYYGTNVATQIACATSTDLINWADQGVVLSPGGAGTWDANGMFDAFARLRQDGVTIEVWYAAKNGSNVRALGYATSTDGINFTKYSGNPIYTSTYLDKGNNIIGEPSIFVPPGREGQEMLISYDSGGQAGTRVISQLMTVDGGNSWHHRWGALLPGSGWESNQVFDSFIYPDIINNTMYLFYGGANLAGQALGINIQIGVASASFLYNSLKQ